MRFALRDFLLLCCPWRRGHLYEEDGGDQDDEDHHHHHHHHEHHEQGDLVADFETQRLRELTQSLTAVIRSLLS